MKHSIPVAITIGFELTSVLIEETAGILTLVVSVLDGETSTPVTVAFNTLNNGTATSKCIQLKTTTMQSYLILLLT